MNPIRTIICNFTEPTTRGRMILGVVANLYDKGAITIVQLITIPLLSRLWGAEGYAIWLMLLTIPTYIAISNFGLGSSAGVVVTRCVETLDYGTAIEAIHSTIAFVMGLMGVVALTALSFAVWTVIAMEADGPFTPDEIAIAVVIITAYGLICAQMSIIKEIYRSTHKFALAMVYGGTLILLEGVALTTIVLSGGSLVGSTVAYFTIRFIGYVLFVRLLKAKEPWVEIGIRRATRAMLRTLAKPSAAALSHTLASALLIQGMMLTLGATAGAATVAIFVASRTLSRAPLQFSGMFLRPSIPELTRAIAKGDHPLESRLNRVNIAVALIMNLPFGLVLLIFGEWLLKVVSGGELQASAAVFAALSIAATANALWMALAAPLVATNRQAEFSHLYLVLCALSLFLVATYPVALFAATLMAIIEITVLVKLMLKTNKTKR